MRRSRRAAAAAWAIAAAFVLALLLHALTAPPATPRASPGSRGPTVLVVQTHVNERYDPGACLAGDRLAGGPADVASAARALARSLSALGIPAEHLADFGADPAQGNAYLLMRERLARELARRPGVRLVVDVHRDAISHEGATGSFRGRPAAQVLLVVGSRPRPAGDGGASPPWRRNLDLAIGLASWLDLHAPGLGRGIWVKPGSYNQELAPASALVEIGGWRSCPAEVARSIPPLARAIEAYLKSTSPDPAAMATMGQMRPARSSP